jgi:hypothetical protein
MQKKFLSILAMLLTAVSGVWAEKYTIAPEGDFKSWTTKIPNKKENKFLFVFSSDSTL